ncbi:MAG: hypothetical protein PF488_02470 [Patescibacteria group bacterium]|jgi:hypothetical protein|nr:hypothetical protein [Patescibacteria group bacterium]
MKETSLIEFGLYLAFVFGVVIAWMAYVIIIGTKNRKEREKREEDEKKKESAKLRIIYDAYFRRFDIFVFIITPSKYTFDIFEDQMVESVIKEEIRRSLKTFQDFVKIDNLINKLPLERKLIFEILLIQSCQYYLFFPILTKMLKEAKIGENKVAEEKLKAFIKKL